MKNILVLIHDDTGQEARLQVALDVTRAVEGHLTCLDVSVVPETAGDYGVMDVKSLLIAEEEQHECENRARLEPRLANEDVPFDWIDARGDLVDCIRDASRLADLIVINRALDHAMLPNMADAASELVIHTGKPILAVPESSRALNIYGHALVAWDGSPESETALRAAVPLLVHAARVTILAVDDRSLTQPATAAAEYLSRHGIKPVVKIEPALTDKASTVILTEIAMSHVAYVVMGGFGHRRFVEAMFGGVTQRMLSRSPVPLFMAH